MNAHPIHEEDLDLYALGALDADERRAVDSHVANCPECAAKLAEAYGRAAALAFAAPRVEPSPAVKARLMQQIRAAGATAAPAPQREPERPRGLISSWWAGVLVPAGIALAIATILLSHENRRLDAQLASLHAAIAQQQSQVQENRDMAQLAGATDTMVIPLLPQPGMPKGQARVVCSSHMGMLYYDGDLEPAPANKSYQLWLIPDHGDPINAGVFNPVAGRDSTWTSKFPQGTLPKAFAVTLEPAGGMPHPTGPKVLVGPVS